MKIFSAVLPAILGIVGVLVGAAMTNISNRTQHLRSVRTDVYSSLLEGQVLLRRGSENRDTALTHKGQQAVRDALLRVAVFSPREVAVPIAAYYSSLPTSVPCALRTAEDLRVLTGMYHALRNANLADDTEVIPDSTMALLALGPCVNRPA